MTGLAYLASIFAVLWLSYWVFRNGRSGPKRGVKREVKPVWSPCDYPEDKVAEAKPDEGKLTGWRSRAATGRQDG
jgi:hypothetical protein